MARRQFLGDFNRLPGPFAAPFVGITYLFPRDRSRMEELGERMARQYGRKYGIYRCVLRAAHTHRTAAGRGAPRIALARRARVSRAARAARQWLSFVNQAVVVSPDLVREVIG